MTIRFLAAVAAGLMLSAAAELPTPVAERVVGIGVLNKQNGNVRFFEVKPGAVIAHERLQIRVRTCETTPPWERPQTGAFLQIDERLRQGGSRRIFSGWLFAESPSLNSVENPTYDVWVRSCKMSFPETGPDSIVVGRVSTASKPAASASSAKKSAEAETTEDNAEQ